MNFGKAILTAREKAGISQAELAERLGVSTGTVAAWELTRKKEQGHGFRIDRLTEIAEALGISVGELVTDAKRSRTAA